MPFLTFVIEGGHLDFKGADMVSLKAGVHAVMDVDIANNRRRFDAELADAAGETEWVVQSIYEGREHDLHLKLSDTGQRLMFEGFIRGIGREKTLTEGVLDFTGVAAADFWQRLYPDVKSPFSGALTLEARLRFEGIPFLDPGRKFTAQGVLDARQGEWQAVDLPGSLLKETAGTVAWELPEESLLSGFPGPASGAFERLEGDFEASESRLRWGRLFLKQEHYVVEMQGVLDVGGGETDMTGKLVMLEDLAREVVAREKRFAVFMNRAGRLVLPFHYSGLYPGGVVAPDKDYVRAAAATLIPEPERAEPVNLRDIPDFSETPQEPESLPRAASASPETVAREPVPAGKPAAPAAAEKTRPGPQESGESDEDIDWFKVLEEM